ncbi:MAG: PEGA domain-containing protein, partial [Aquificota bacterium]
GKIVIKDPPNADVYINGKHVGKTPIQLELREGKYNITVAKEPFIEETKKNVQVYFDKSVVLSFNPTKKGLLKADSIPKGAEVWDKKEYLGKTPLSVKINPGIHNLLFYKGKLSAERKVNIQYKKTTEIFVNLEKAVIHLNANPPNAKIYIDGKLIAKIPSTVELEEGVHKINIIKNPYKDEFDLKVKKGDELNVTYELRSVQLPPVQAYGPVKFTHNGKYLVSMGKAGIYFWNVKKFKPQISLFDPEDVRNFDKFINFEISKNDEFVVGIKPIRKLAYSLKTNQKMDKILVWDLKTTAVKFSNLYPTVSKFAFFSNDNSKIFLIEENGKIDILNLSDKKLNNVSSINNKISSAVDLGNNILIGDEKGNLYTFEKENNTLKKVHSFKNKIRSIQISKDRKFVIISHKYVSILDTNNFNEIKKINEKNPFTATLSPDSTLISISTGKTVKVYDLKNKTKKYEIKNLPANIISIVFRDNKVLITASGIKTPYIGIWKNGHLLRKWVQTIE